MVTAHRARLLAGCLLSVVLVGGSPAAAQVGASPDGEWPTYGGDLGNTKYSPLDQIDRDNFGDLEIAWRWRSADGFLSKSNAAGGELWADSRFIFAELDREDPDPLARPRTALSWRTSRRRRSWSAAGST